MERIDRIRGVLFLLVGLGTAGLVLVLWGFGVINPLERNSIDARFSVRGNQKPDPRVVVVAIDDVTFSDLRIHWPFPRELHARLLDRINAGHPTAIAFDVQFTEATTPRQDGALLDAVDRAGNVVLATTEVGPGGTTAIFGGDKTVRSVHARPANGRVLVDSQGVARKVPYAIQGLKTLAVVTVERTGKPVSRKPFGKKGAWIDFAGPSRTYPTYSYSRVLRGRVPSTAFKNKIVVIGPSAQTLQDIRATPTDPLMSGAEIHANAIATVLRGLPLRNVPSALTIFLILLLALLVPGVSLGNKVRISMSVAVLAAAGYVVATQLSFNSGWILSFVYPLTALALSTTGALGVHIVLTAFEREQVRSIFSRFVPATVVKEVLARTDSDLRLASEEVEGTVMFTDLRGFTSASEHLPAPQVFERINRLLEEIAGAVLAHGGTLVSYTGDGVMAVFGAPIEQPDHAQRAFAAATDMLENCLPRWNTWLRERGFHQGFEMGVGLNSGPFMTGNIGSAQRLAYTAIGDTINTCSRIEALTKETPYTLHVAESTYELLKPEDATKLTYIAEMSIRGRTTKLKLWGMGLSPVPPKPAEVQATL
jgi:adenylate cyclase